jgi:hypothetical protein
MKILIEEQATLFYDQEGHPYFHHGETTWYLEDFLRIDPKHNFGYYAGTHISNTGGILINVDEKEEIVHFAIVS